jgi:hypothetical protein
MKTYDIRATSYYENAEGGPQNGDIFVDNIDRHVVILEDRYHYLSHRESSGFTGISSGSELTGSYQDHSVESEFKSQLPRRLIVRNGHVLPETENRDVGNDRHA